LEHKCLIIKFLSMKILLCLAYCVLCLSFHLFAQKFKDPKAYAIERKTLEDFREDKFVTDGGFIGGNIKYSEIAGTPYLDKNFTRGKVVVQDGTMSDGCLLRYNIYTDQIEHSDEGKIFELAPKALVKRAELDKHVFTCLKYKVKGKTTDQYFEVLTIGKVSLYKRYTVKYIPASTSFPYAKTDSAHFSLPAKSFYAAKGTNQLIRVKNGKGLLKMLDDKKSEVKYFITTKRLSADNEDDMQKILAYYNGL
jgi:hypothetical protein